MFSGRPTEMVPDECLTGHDLYFEPFDDGRTRLTLCEWRNSVFRQVGRCFVLTDDSLEKFARAYLSYREARRDAASTSRTNLQRSQPPA